MASPTIYRSLALRLSARRAAIGVAAVVALAAPLLLLGILGMLHIGTPSAVSSVLQGWYLLAFSCWMMFVAVVWFGRTNATQKRSLLLDWAVSIVLNVILIFLLDWTFDIVG